VRRLLVIALISSLFACSDDLPNADGALVDKLRILAVRADRPEVAPDERAVLSALVMDPKGGGRALTWTWLACDPALEDFYGSPCSDGDRIADLTAFAKRPDVHDLGHAETAVYQAPFGLFGTRAPDDPLRYFGVPAEILLVVSAGTFEEAAEGTVESQTALVRVAVSDLPAGLKNANPVIAALVSEASDGYHLEVPASSAQLFFDIDPTVPEGFSKRPEALFARWFVTSGTVAVGAAAGGVHGASARFTGSDQGTGAVVLYDGRGGVAFRSFDLHP
jgi:hypothetical protein